MWALLGSQAWQSLYYWAQTRAWFDFELSPSQALLRELIWLTYTPIYDMLISWIYTLWHAWIQVYWWHDKYRPRKPKYFNRVHTGYEWNKYNQTHYDHDNPPPKIVQGYKFNIFYPDLVDKSKAPIYTIEKDGDSGETCIIRFHAGPPYEDIVSYLYSLA